MTKIPDYDSVKSLASCIVLKQGVLWDFKTEVQTGGNKILVFYYLQFVLEVIKDKFHLSHQVLGYTFFCQDSKHSWFMNLSECSYRVCNAFLLRIFNTQEV